MEGMLTHVARADCFIAQPHAAAACGIISAWWDQVQASGRPDEPDSTIVMEAMKK
jgi:hypothetical protein